MSDHPFNYIWRCCKCSYHFANITKMDGILKQEKKCPKCKSLNIITVTNRELFIQCKSPDDNIGGYGYESEESYPYQL